MELDFSNDTIEKLLLKRAIVDKRWLNILLQVFDKRWFKDERISLSLVLILNFYKKYNTLPNNNIIQALAKKYFEKYPQNNIKITDIQQLFTEISNLNLNLSEEVLSANIKEFIRRNAFYNSLFDNAELLEQSPENYQKVVDKCIENFDRVQKITFNDLNLGMDYFDEQNIIEHWDFIKNPEAKIKTGWDSIDKYTNGGFLRSGKMLGLIMAQAGLGKSVFLSNLAVNFLKQNLSVVVISLEMSENVYACRFDSHISNKDINKLSENETDVISKIREFKKKYSESNLYVKEYPPRSITTRDIETYLENLKNNDKKIDVIIIDYLNLVLPNSRTDSMFRDGMAVSEELRGLSYKFSAPVISAVQCNTEGMQSADIDMQNVSESRGIVHTVDVLFALYQMDEDRENGIINLKVIKNRLGGMVGKHSQFALNPETLVLNDITFDSNAIDIVKDIENNSDNSIKLEQISSDILNI